MQTAGQTFKTSLGREVRIIDVCPVTLCDRCDWLFPIHQANEVVDLDCGEVITLCPNCREDVCQPGWGWIDGYREATKEDV